jgi:hypothetical protein
MKTCLNCERELEKYQKKYCTIQCQKDYEWKQMVEFYEVNGYWDGVKNDSRIRKNIRKYLLAKNGNVCSICRTRKWTGKPIPLIVDHIDGDSSNNKPSNVRMVCGNCDMLLPTYKNKNRGNGRSYRAKRYKDGKSF